MPDIRKPSRAFAIRELSPNKSFSHYRILSKIGAGGMGDVYLAEDTRLDRRVALKILPPEFAGDADRMRRFVLEAKSASALNHPNIITIYEIGETEGTNFIATEYIEGKTLNNCDALSLTAALDVATQIASALQAAHSAGIVHRDMKPDNVIIRPDGLVKILDFGIAKQSGLAVVRSGSNQPTNEEAATALKQLTGTGTIIGTAAYMSPEQARGKAIDSRSDIFSFGVVLYEMLSGRKPFAGENPMDVIGSIIADEPRSLKELLPSLPDEVERIVSKSLRKNRDQRHQTAGELLVELKDLQRRLDFEAQMERSSPPTEPVEAGTEIIPPQTRTQTGSHNSIAVLPFSHLSADADNEYFCDGLAEELLNALTRIENLRVAARSSSFSFKGRNVNVSEIGRALNVNTVLEGSVRKSGDRLRISVQLCNAADGYQLWSERYDREIKDIFEVQDEITLAVVDALKLTLLGDEKDEILKRYTKNAEAYQLYLRGRFLFFKRTPEGFRKAIEYFGQAIELDAEYALAYSGLADCFTFLGFYEHVAPAEAESNLKAPAFKSLELDNTLAETHTSVALYRSLYQWDFQEGDKEHKRAIALNPTYALAHHLDSATVILLGRNDEAIAAEQRAIELDPFTAIFNASLGWWLYLSRRNDEAIAQSLKTIEIAPNHFFAHWVLGLAYGLVGKFDEAIASLQKASALTDGTPHIKADLARLYAQNGKDQEAQTLLAELRNPAKGQYVSPVNLAKILLGLGEFEQMYEQLEKAFAERSVRLPWLMLDPILDRYRSESRFQDLLRRMGLPAEKTAQRSAADGAETVMFDSTADRSGGHTAVTANASAIGDDFSLSTSRSPTSQATARRSVIAGILGIFLVTVLGVGSYFYYDRSSSKQINSIAVMPFVNEGSNADVEYLVDGMTETLISNLSQIPNLSVKARSTVFFYKGKETTPKKIGDELGVQAVLLGRVEQHADDLRLSLELVNAQTQDVLWSDTYNRKQSELVSLQSEIARDVLNKLKSKLSGADVARVEKTYTANPEAYQLYLKGKFFWNKRTGESLKQAADFYQQAIEKDPNYALAYSGLAETYVLFSSYDVAPADDSMPQGKAAAQRALAIDDSLAEAHNALAFYLSYYEWDRGGSEKEYRRAIELKPNYATAHHWLGADLSNLKRFDDSLVELRRAEELDPLSPIIGTNLGDTLVFARRYDEAIAQYKRTLVRNPGFAYAHLALGRAFAAKGMYPEAIAEARTAIELNSGSAAKGFLGLWLAKSGRRDETVKLLGELKQESTRKYVQSLTFAFIYIALGDKEEAINHLEKHMSSRAETASSFAVDPELDELRSEPRFKAMLKRMSLPE